MGWIWAGVIAFCVVMWMAANEFGPQEAPAQQPATALSATQKAKALELVAAFRTSGIVTKHDCATNEAHVSPLAWQTVDAEGKKSLTASLAAACDALDSGRYITVYDSQSGKELGGWGAFGFSVK